LLFTLCSVVLFVVVIAMRPRSLLIVTGTHAMSQNSLLHLWHGRNGIKEQAVIWN